MLIPQSVIDKILTEEAKPVEATEAFVDTANEIIAGAGTALKTGIKAGQAALDIKGTIGKNSITRMASDSILPVPCVISDYCDVDDQIAIAKYFEKYYAALFVSIFSLRPNVSLNEYRNVAEYVKSIHSGNAIPTNFKKMEHFANEALSYLSDEYEISEEGLITIKESLINKIPSPEKIELKKLTKEWNALYKEWNDLISTKEGKYALKHMKPVEMDNQKEMNEVGYKLNAVIKKYMSDEDLRKRGNMTQKELQEHDKKDAKALALQNDKEYIKACIKSSELGIKHFKTSISCLKNYIATHKNQIENNSNDEDAEESFFINEDEFCLFGDEEPSAIGIKAETFFMGEKAGSKVASEAWEIFGGQLDSESLNDVVQPYKRTEYLLNDRLNLSKKTQAATEAKISEIPSMVANGFSNVVDKVIHSGKNNNDREKPGALTANSVKGSAGVSAIKAPGYMAAGNSKAITAEPTMINVTFYVHGSKSGAAGAGANFTQSVVLGVKSMVRTVPTDIMVSSLVEGTKSSNPIFKFISWTRGEYKVVRDLIFNISEIKKTFKNKKDDKFGFLEMSKNRKDVDDVSKFAGNRVLPYLTVIASEMEVERAASITGVDLHQYRNAKAFMDKYYLLAFAIYNENTKYLKVLFDGHADWETLSMSYIEQEQKKSADVTKLLANMFSAR